MNWNSGMMFEKAAITDRLLRRLQGKRTLAALAYSIFGSSDKVSKEGMGAVGAGLKLRMELHSYHELMPSIWASAKQPVTAR